MNTAIMMMAMYNAQAIINSETVARDWFKLSVGKFHEKIRSGEIRIPLVLMEEESQKCAKGVHSMDFAEYVDTPYPFGEVHSGKTGYGDRQNDRVWARLSLL